jgi:hypothetical protein
LADILSTLEDVYQLKTVEVNRTLPLNPGKDGLTYPVAMIRTGPDFNVPSESCAQMDEWRWTVSIEVITQATKQGTDDIETLMGVIHPALMADRTVGGYADHIRRVGSDMEFDFDLPSGYQAMRLSYEIPFELGIAEA